MKGIPIVLAAVLSYPSMASVVADEGTGAVDLHAVEATVGQILEQDHYTQRKLDSNMAKQVLETYLEILDYNKLFFTQEDIGQIGNEYSSGLGDDILLGNLTSAKHIYEIFKQRVDQRVAKINELLTQRYNFSSNRTVTANRAKEPWPANASEADRIWRDWIEKELLEEKLSTSPTEPRPEVVGRHYRDLQNQIDHQDDEEVIRIFLEAVAQTYDPHSEYLGPSELNEFRIDTRLTISGIGVQIRMENGYGALKITIEKVYRVTGESTQLKGVISDVTIPSLTDSAEFGESEQEHPLTYDQVAPIANDAAGNHKPLFLDELRNRSIKRINEDPVFHDLSAEIQLIKQKLWDNCVSLNEEVRRNEMAEEVCMRDKGNSDRITASAHDRTRYYRLMLADVDKPYIKA
jgi:hypothetical protein